MKIRNKSVACAIGAALAATLLAVASLSAARASGEEDVHLVDKMAALQYFMHKAGLSIRGGSLELADFYLHEMEEVLEEVEEIESYDGQPVGQLSEAMLGPAFHALEEAVDSGNPETALSAYQAVLNTCNTCHVATEFGFIKIEDRSTENPYMQSFGM